MKIRQLEPDEWGAFRDMRLLALRTEAGLFYSTFERESPMEREFWQKRIRSEKGVVFGLFDGDRLVGITGTYTPQEDPTGQTAGLGMSFILPEYRGRGLSKMLYETRIEWIRNQPHYRRIVVGHRASNEASRHAIERHGFVRIGSEPYDWPDGVTEEHVNYEMILDRPRG